MWTVLRSPDARPAGFGFVGIIGVRKTSERASENAIAGPGRSPGDGTIRGNRVYEDNEVFEVELGGGMRDELDIDEVLAATESSGADVANWVVETIGVERGDPLRVRCPANYGL
jgi:hypothetical protein